ncbi:PIG-L family deacetylase [Virgibacillus pantothenticus]|uniref:PIG-L family deacetylase n=1 Tax=Virgibacillus pantothenticus TaxID=1473 RepID=UPI00098425FA|nr:PIG-L family deacetylase [Virgibacillus pantothenticus]
MNIIVSPHYDDAVLSLGNFINILLLNGEQVLVINLFTDCPPNLEALSPVAQLYLREDTGKEEITVNDALAMSNVRKQEDREALRLIGVKSIDINLYDAIYRGNPWYYPLEKDLFSGINDNETSYYKDIIKLLNRKGLIKKENTYYFPAGIGSHVDHIITLKVGLELMSFGYNCNFYQEFPYNYGSFEESNFDFSRLNFNQRIIDVVSDKKSKAIMCYVSQRQWLTKSLKEMNVSLWNYSEKIWTNIGGKYHAFK